jgi:hypothetical protein
MGEPSPAISDFRVLRSWRVDTSKVLLGVRMEVLRTRPGSRRTSSEFSLVQRT